MQVVRAEPQPRPDRLIYAITADGRSELARWLAEPVVAVGYRDDLTKLVAARAGADTVRSVVRAERKLLGELHALRRSAAASKPMAALLVEGAALQAQARLSLLDLARRTPRRSPRPSPRALRSRSSASDAA